TPGALSWTTSGSTSPSTVNRGSPMTLSATVRATQSVQGLVDVEGYTAAGQRVYQRYWDNQAFQGNANRTFGTSWQVPANLAPGTYILKIGVFRPGWAGMYIWNHNART